MLALACEDENFLAANPEIDKACPWLAVAPALKEFKAKKGDMATLYGHPELNVPRVLVIGLGKKENLTIKELRDAIAKGTRKCRELGMESILLPEPMLARMPGGLDRIVEECVCASLLSLYRFTELKTITEDIDPDPRWLALGFTGENTPESSQLAARRGENSAEAVKFARNLANMPGNRLYPEKLALCAADLAKKNHFKCTVLNEEILDEEGLGCILAVGGGSSHPPRLIVVEHAPQGHEEEKPLILIGKGITFDSGGICLKPAANMFQMKCDMSGAAAVLAVINALALEAAPRRVVGIMPCAENMPDGRAYRPGDVLVSANGQTVEVINTDAEGRLALCDAIVYAQKHFTPAAIVDIATLTGACAVALGTGVAGLFCDDDNFAEKLEACAASVGENFWRLPLWKPYEESLKSEVADIKHTASREGGAITAALFLKHFVHEGSLWAHLDIAGVDWSENGSPLCSKGATAFGARTLLELARGGLA